MPTLYESVVKGKAVGAVAMLRNSCSMLLIKQSGATCVALWKRMRTFATGAGGGGGLRAGFLKDAFGSREFLSMTFAM